jgi:hypothetical protein
MLTYLGILVIMTQNASIQEVVIMPINQFQMTGDVNVVIRAITPTNINGITYQTNEVITNFTGDVLVNYNDINTLARTNKNELAKNDVFADSMQITPKIMNEGLYNLIGKKLPSNTKAPLIKKETSDPTGSIFLNRTLDNSFFMVKKDSQTVSGYTVDYATGIISGLEADTEYRISAYQIISQTVASYSFENMPLPYFMIELVGAGNINNASTNFLLRIPKVNINSAPQLNFDNESIVNVVLTANIINSQELELHYY